jgi:hypothetical protein
MAELLDHWIPGVHFMIRIECMNDHFTKLHVQVSKFGVTLHHFTGPDLGDPHDHPFAFTTTILAGGYIEDVWRRGNDGWSSRLVHREPGTSHRVGARSVHRIVELPLGECVTSIVLHSEGVKRRQPRFWRFRNGVMWTRRWNETAFKRAALKKS